MTRLDRLDCGLAYMLKANFADRQRHDGSGLQC